MSLGIAQGEYANSFKPLKRIVDGSPPAKVLERIAATLAHPLDVNTALESQISFEFARACSYMDEIAFGDARAPKPKGGNTPHPFLFKRNRTHNKFASIARAQLENITKPLKARSPLQSPTIPTGLASLSSNAYGDYLVSLGFAPSVNVMDRPASQRALLRAKVGLLRHRLANGSLPATLAELVPTYLNTVPLDPYDGKPVRYSPARGAVWVIGSDLNDNGGSTRPIERGYRNNDPDPTMFVIPHENTPSQ